ncbi:MAG TPA: DNA-processing protein DprA [Candidatus Binataceae bacterium]|jgi:DNA processing protein|nr:DNA-processing protein DprA [Candidatus Binataceae bacterium]
MSTSIDAYWLALRRVHGVGTRVARLLLDKFGEAPRVFALREEELLAAGIYRPTAKNIVQFAQFEALEKELCELTRLGGSLIRWSDDNYPANLRQIPDPPPFLYLRGTLPAGETDCVAIVGARAASDAGLHMAHRVAMELALKRITVVSGLARGVDAQAHRGALEGNGRTIAVLGCGLDIIYPPEHRKLADSMLEQGGALLSELPLGSAPVPENFPVRNRLIAGLSLGVVVVEAAEKSGSLITARLALEQNRQVFAVPGSPLTGKTRGSNRLLKEGARLVDCVEDVMEELAPQLTKTAASRPVPVAGTKMRPEQPIYQAAGREQQFQAVIEHLSPSERVHIDSIVESSGMNAQTVLGVLLELEWMGTVTQYPGKLFSLAQI